MLASFSLALAAIGQLATPAPQVRQEQGWPVLSAGGLTLCVPADGAGVRLFLHDAPVALPLPAGLPDGARWVLPQGTLTERWGTWSERPGTLTRQVQFTNTSGARVDLTGVELLLTGAPGSSVRNLGGRFSCLTAPGLRGTLVVGFASPDDDASALEVGGPAQRLGHRVRTAWRLEPGQTATIGTQYLWLDPGDLATGALASIHDWYDRLGYRLADGGPDWFRDALVYQVSAGGSVDSRFGDGGGFLALAQQLDYLADLGFNATWLMSVTTHKLPADPLQGWNLYGPRRFDQVDPAYGGDAELRQLMAGFRARGFRVLGEIVPHGGVVPALMEHPEWWTYDRAGQHVRLFGEAPDYSQPGWQAVVQETITRLTREFGFDGYRVDVAPGFGVNWHGTHNLPHVSRSTLGGSTAMLRAIRAGAVAGGASQPAIVPESLETPAYVSVAPVGYGFPLINLVERLIANSAAPAEMVRTIREHLLEEQAALPRDMIVWRSLANHDTVVDHGRADRRFGVGLQQALVGLTCVIDGVPLVYHEQETGSFHAYRRLFWARRRVPELRRGAADYRLLADQVPPGVFAVRRVLAGRQAVGLVNLTPQSVSGTLPRGALGGVPAGTVCYEAVAEGQVKLAATGLAWRLEPYGTAVYRLGAAPEGSRPALATKVAVSLPWRSRTLPDGWQFAATPADAAPTIEPQADGSLRLQFSAAGPQQRCTLRPPAWAQWAVQTVTGVYSDLAQRRHFPWPGNRFPWTPNQVWGNEPHHLYAGTLPVGRVWQSVVAPLAPGGQIAFAGADGRGVVVREVRTNAANVVLQQEPDGALELRWLLTDPALRRDWTPGYRGNPWVKVQQAPPPEPGSLTVELVLAPLDRFAEFCAQAPPPQAFQRPTAQVGPGPHHLSLGRLWLIEPNTVDWQQIDVPADGKYDLLLELRHSERAGSETELTEHYRLRFDDRPLSFTWQQLHTWSTGNGYFGRVRIPLGELSAGRHRLHLQTTHTWCALGLPVELVAAR
ncbi:MAG: hypothetical protein IT204_07900 [Fimbriimonadaceae bacterium]|nr:hypothetical protein [Fimbriimonadaceae bacterium]